MTLYSKDFYMEQQDESLQSAREVVPIIVELLKPNSVIDVGCGVGTWLSVFNEFGIEDILGIDGDYVQEDMLHISKEYFKHHDLCTPINIERKFDLVVSLEVGEHLPKEQSKIYIESLVNLGPVILFSAAVPYQTGVGHINEQWPEYWTSLFEEQNYVCLDIIRPKIWENIYVSFWYAQNMHLYIKKDHLTQNKNLLKLFKEHSFNSSTLVHPELFLRVKHSGEFNILNICNKLFNEKEYGALLSLKGISHPIVIYFIGRAYKMQNDNDNSTKYLKQYLETLDKQYVVSAFYHLGEILYFQEEYEESVLCFKQCHVLTRGDHLAATKYIEKISSMLKEDK